MERFGIRLNGLDIANNSQLGSPRIHSNLLNSLFMTMKNVKVTH